MFYSKKERNTKSTTVNSRTKQISQSDQNNLTKTTDQNDMNLYESMFDDIFFL